MARPLILALGIGAGLLLMSGRAWSTPKAGLPFEATFIAASKKYGLPAGLLSRVAYQESRYNPLARNPNSGALGMMQFMEATADELGIDPLNPTEAIYGAAKYLRQLHDRFGSWALALAAYNWGMGNLGKALSSYGAAWLANTPTETFNYVTSITRDSGLPLA